MDLRSLTPEPMDEYELLMLMARHIQFDRSCFGDKVLVIHLDTNEFGKALISKVAVFDSHDQLAPYYYANGNTTRPAILFKSNDFYSSLFLSGATAACLIKVYSNNIKTEFKSGGMIESNKRLLKTMTEQEIYAAMIDLEEQCLEAISNKAE